MNANKFFIVVGQIAVGIVAGNVLGEVMDKAVVNNLKKVVNAKKNKNEKEA